MIGPQQEAVRNRLLTSMSCYDFDLIRPFLIEIELPLGHLLEQSGQIVNQSVFFESGIGSSVVKGCGKREVVSLHTGFEGMSGRSIVDGAPWAQNSIQIQAEGRGYAIPRADLLMAVKASPSLDRQLRRFGTASDNQATHTLLSTATDTLLQRLARWMLMWDDRIDGKTFPMTHECLSHIFGVRRASITGAVHLLEGELAIRATRGMVEICDRAILIRLAAGSYGLPEAEYERLLPLTAPKTERLPIGWCVSALDIKRALDNGFSDEETAFIFAIDDLEKISAITSD